MNDGSRGLRLPALGALMTAVIALLGLPNPVASNEPESRNPELVLVGDRGLDRLVLEVEVDGKPLLASWNEAMAALLRHVDRDGDAVLDQAEANRLPSAFGLRQLSWGVFRLDGPAPPWPKLDTDGDAKVGAAELSTFYCSRGLGPVLVGLGRPRFTGQLNKTLVRALDADHDGRVRKGEFRNAGAMLETFDRNGDERLTADELVAAISYPGTRGTLWLAPSSSVRASADAREVPLVLLPLWDEGGRWVEDVARRPGNSRTADPLRAWRDRTQAHRWAVRLGGPQKDSRAPGRLDGGQPLAPGAWRTAAADGLAWHLRADEGTLAENLRANRKQIAALFAEADPDHDGRVPARDLEDPSRALLALVLPWADRDSDGALSRMELDTWFALLESLTRGSVLLTVLDHGRGLFEVMDTDHDGALSARELRASGESLEKGGAMVDGVLSLDRLPRTLIGCVSRGHPRAALAARPTSGPDWFQGMDRNRDGDVSAREWVGDSTLFRDLDADHDSLLTPQEATRTP